MRCQPPWQGLQEALCWRDQQQIPGLLCWPRSRDGKSAHMTTTINIRDHQEQKGSKTNSELFQLFHFILLQQQQDCHWHKYLQAVQNVAVKRCDKTGLKRAHIKLILKELLWLPVAKCIQGQVLSTVYCSVKGPAPLYLLKLFSDISTDSRPRSVTSPPCLLKSLKIKVHVLQWKTLLSSLSLLLLLLLEWISWGLMAV